MKEIWQLNCIVQRSAFVSSLSGIEDESQDALLTPQSSKQITTLQIKNRYQFKDIASVLVRCQSTIHYSFKSMPYAQLMFRNASECLVPSGHFIVTTPDANDYVCCVRDAPGLKFGDDEFHIELHG
ncbi:hypothetical protein MRX96_013460 [Rhipicephalus microplus]|uniref:mRNA cap 0 methyltransferase domain-containing protein n=1 Tax=Rhipicephalus microplus TaxID=6941 RepID=A0A9J6E193_RHIMP|nr:hypothetical protein HPB51_012855 [Rhipicephalus microplus]